MSLITDIMEHIQDVLIDNLNPLKADIDHLHAKVEEITVFATFANQKYEETINILKKEEVKYNEILQD